MPSIKTQDLYRASITEAAGIAASGDVDFTVSVAPTRTNGFLVLSPENATSREVVYFHNVIGNRIYVRGVNRRSPKLHPVNDSVQMNDVEDIFNYYSDMVSPLFYMEKTGALNVRIWGGTILVNRSQVTVADTNLTLTDNATNYIVYDYLTNIVSVNTTGVGLVKVTVTVTAGVIGTPTYNVIKESYADPYVPDLALVAPEVQKQTWVYATATGAVNTYAITLSPAPTSYQAGQKFTFKANLANTGTATLNVNGLGAKTIKKLGNSTNLVANDILLNQEVEVIYDGTDFQMVSPLGTIPIPVPGQDNFGYLNIPQNSQSSNYTLVSSDLGKHIYHPSSDSSARDWIIPDGLAIGSTVKFVNEGGEVDLICTTDTFKKVGETASSSIKILQTNGYATILKVTPTKWLIDSSTLSTGNIWRTKANMTTARYSLTSSAVNNKIYCIGGYNGSHLNTNEEYDTLTNTWSTKANMTTARQTLTSSAVNNKIYCIGGYNGSSLNTNEEYDTLTNTWSTKANMTTARYTLTSSVVNNKIYCIGGYNGSYIATNEEYDTLTNTWSTKANMTTARGYLASSVVNNKIYCIGGNNGPSLNTNEEYDTLTNTWSTKANMTTARYTVISGAVNNKIYCIGGYNGSFLATNEEYDTLTNTWSTKANMTTARGYLTSSVVNNKIYCIGGDNGSSIATNEVYIP